MPKRNLQDSIKYLGKSSRFLQEYYSIVQIIGKSSRFLQEYYSIVQINCFEMYKERFSYLIVTSVKESC